MNFIIQLFILIIMIIITNKIIIIIAINWIKYLKKFIIVTKNLMSIKTNQFFIRVPIN
jgi:hypothetical protein